MTTVNTAQRPATPMPWWSSPLGLAIGFQVPLMGLLWWASASPGAMETLTVRGFHFLTATYVALGFGVIAMMALGGAIGAQLSVASSFRDDPQTWQRAAAVVGTVAAAAYCIWFRDYLFNPLLMLRILLGDYVPSRDDIELTPGVTSLVNLAPVFFSIYAYGRLVVQWPQRSRLLDALCIVLAALTLFRVYAWSERLALIEVAAPTGLALSAALMKRRGGFAQLVRWSGPYLAIPLVILFFGAAESVRSWSSDTYNGKQDFWAFAISRLASYYYVALNNGAGLLSTGKWPTFTFEFVLAWAHGLPLVGHQFSELVGAPKVLLPDFMVRYGDPEFNSPSGMFAPIVDLGVPLGMACSALIGLLAGLAFRAYSERRLIGVVAYPALMINALELFRYPYLGEPRAFTWAMGIGIVMLCCRPAIATASSTAWPIRKTA